LQKVPLVCIPRQAGFDKFESQDDASKLIASSQIFENRHEAGSPFMDVS
jgi:hypothetical protein